jgi:bacterioferritin-associated ferredoxin
MSMIDRRSEESELLCGCSAITVQQYYDYLAANPKDFDEVLRETGAGQACTACLLDLEYHYVRAFEANAQARVGANVLRDKKPVEKISFKRRIYNAIDALAPLVPMNLRQVAPVIYGAGVKQCLCVCNDSLLYEGGLVAPPFHLDTTLRDGEGRIVDRRHDVVAAGEDVRIDLSGPLETAGPSADGELKVGWMDLMRRSASPGIRGTTRPQVEIVSKAGTCAVHTQAESDRLQGGLTIRLRPGEDRHFAAVVNVERKPLSYRLMLSTQALNEPVTMAIEVPACGARLVEVPIPPIKSHDRLGVLAELSWTLNRMNKVYVLCATPDLDRFSVDHA